MPVYQILIKTIRICISVADLSRNFNRTKLYISWSPEVWILSNSSNDRMFRVSTDARYFDWFWTWSCTLRCLVTKFCNVSRTKTVRLNKHSKPSKISVMMKINQFRRFEKDINNDPPVMVLQPISKILPNFLSNLIPAKQEADQRKWYEALCQMQALFRTASDCLYRVFETLIKNKLLIYNIFNYLFGLTCRLIF